MDTRININFKVTPEQREKIESRAFENGFDDISAYIKVVALKTHKFSLSDAGSSTQEPSIQLGFDATQGQIEKIEESMQACKCEDMNLYLLYVALHSAVSSVVEVRSTGNLDSMLERIANSRKPKELKRLF